MAIIYGTDGENRLRDTPSSDTIYGYGGYDYITAFRGPSDTIYAGSGDDIVFILTQFTSVDGGDGYDVIHFNGSDPVTLDLQATSFEEVRGGMADDHFDASSQVVGVYLNGRLGDDTLIGSSYDDTIRDIRGSNYIMAGGGDDKIVATTESIVNGGIGLDGVIYLGAGNVTIDVAAASLERIQLADGNDVVDGSGVAEALTMLGRDGDDQLTGGAGKNRIMGGRGNDILKGGGENDFLFAGEGSNTISGGAGNDIINSALGSDAILAGSGDDRITANVRFTSLDGGVGFDRLTLIGSTGVTLDLSATHIEFVRGDLGDDTIDGSSQTTAVTIFGNDGNDTLTGSDFNDFLEGGHGNDYIKGGGGVDKASFQDSDAGVLVSLLLTGEQSTNDGNDTLVGIENLLGSSHSDTLIGDDGANVLDGGGGADLLIGGHGNDLYRVDILSDRINEQAGDGTDTVQSWTSYELPDNVERLVLEGSENYSGIGNSSSNFIRGNSGDNYLAGAAGNDGLNGGAGRDDLLGQAGNDRLVGEEGADHLEGGAGDDVLDGGNGDDRLEDGLGSDMLTGGAGADSFVFGERESPDVQDGIVDFSHAEGDKINLVSIDADTTASGDQAFNFIGTADFHGTAGELRYEQTATSTLLSGDTNGDGNADFTIALTGLHDLQGGDFVL